MAAYLPGWLAGWLRAGLGLLHGLAAWLALAAWLPGFAFAFGFGLGFVGLDCAGLGWAKPTKPFHKGPRGANTVCLTETYPGCWFLWWPPEAATRAPHERCFRMRGT